MNSLNDSENPLILANASYLFSETCTLVQQLNTRLTYCIEVITFLSTVLSLVIN